MTGVPFTPDGMVGGRAAAARVRAWLAAHATTVPFRLAVALGLLGLQLAVAVHSGQRFNAKFNAAPGSPPRFQNPASDWAPNNWDRLIVSRWDSGNYIELGLRGYQYCPPRGPTLPVHAPGCNLAFYPTYGLAGRYVGKVTGLPIDFAMWGISLVSSFLFLFLWTGKDLTSRLGVVETYLALAFLQRLHDRLLPGDGPDGAVDAGAGAGRCRRFRATAPPCRSAPGWGCDRRSHHGRGDRLAFAAGLLVELLRERPRAVWPGSRGALLAVVSVWGQVALMAYHAHRFGDPMTYVHAHGQLFHHEQAGLGSPVSARPRQDRRSRSIFRCTRGCGWRRRCSGSSLGHREALRRFPLQQQAFWYVTYLATVGIATVGMMPISLAGMSRYLLLAFADVLCDGGGHASRDRCWRFYGWRMTAWHYWNVDICTYTGGMGDHVLTVCHTAHWIRH